jgi:hypothetical protein
MSIHFFLAQSKTEFHTSNVIDLSVPTLLLSLRDASEAEMNGTAEEAETGYTSVKRR